jgi:hypothetical protein
MEAAPLESMEAAMPVMVQLPQLTVTALLAVTEQQQAEQVFVLTALSMIITALPLQSLLLVGGEHAGWQLALNACGNIMRCVFAGEDASL